LKLKTHYPTVIIGATAYGIGFASQKPDEVLVIERTALVAPEYIDSLHVGSTEWNPTEPMGFDLKNELLSRNVLSAAGRFHAPGAASTLFDLIQKKDISVLFLTDVIGIEKMESDYEITIYNNSGFQKISAGRVIDTTPKADKKSINAFVVSNGNPCDHPMLRQGRFENEFILCVPLEMEDDWIAARKKVHTFWQNRDAGLKDWTLVSIASTFDFTVDNTVDEPGPYAIQERWEWMPGNAYGNLLEAFEAGIKGGMVK